MPSETLSREAAVRAWVSSQDFGPKQPRSVREVVAERSFVRMLGGADPYFALFARGVAPEREAVDKALLEGAVRVTPAVRGCMYLVAAEHADLALSVADHHGRARSQRELEKAGGTTKQVTKTAKAITKALAGAALTTAELRKQVAKAITSFGEPGKKVGLSSSLPPALRELEFDGAIERTPIDGRLDTETYRWSLRETALTRHAAADANRAVAELFFAHHAPASLEQFASWAGLGKKAAKAAIASLELIEVQVENHDGEGVAMWATQAALDAAHRKSKSKPKSKPNRVALLGLQDLYLVVHDGPGWMCPAAHLELEIPRWGPMRGGPIRETKHPHLRAVLVEGELAGFWDVSAAMDRQQLAWLDAPSKALARAADKQAAALREFMRAALGHAKTFSIDSDEKIDARFELVRGLGA